MLHCTVQYLLNLFRLSSIVVDLLYNKNSLQIHNKPVPCGLQGCKNRTHSLCWPEVIKGVQNQGVDCSVSYGGFFCSSFVFRMYLLFCFVVFGCQYHCNQLLLKTLIRNDLLFVEARVGR